MIYSKINLIDGNENVYLEAYISDVKNPIRDAMLIIPGGGYVGVCSDREGEPIAFAFLSKGMNAFVLHYSVCPDDRYQPLIEASLAMEHIRNNAEKYSINPDRVFSVGFSAGGHLCGSLGTMWNDKVLNERISIEYGINKPKAMILCYPVISADKSFAHLGSFDNLLGNYANDEAVRNDFSIEKRVNKDTCPAFIIHTAEDTVVPVNNALVMAQALSSNGIFFELHIYPKGPHGIALADTNTNLGNSAWIDAQYARWVDDVMIWIKRL